MSVKNELKMPLRSILKRGHYLYFLFYYLYSGIMDLHIGGFLMGGTVFNTIEGVYGVQCISYPYLRLLLKRVHWSEEDVFIDIGCAWGRLLGFLERKTTINRLIGIEINDEAARTAARIFQGHPRVEIISGDAVRILPNNGTILYLFNPFDKIFMNKLLDRIENIYTHSVTVYYLHPLCRQVFDQRNDRWQLTEEIELIPKHLCSLTLCMYVLKKGRRYPSPGVEPISIRMADNSDSNTS